MKSTINEQTISFTGATSLEAVEMIKNWMAEEFGWEVDGDNVYFSESQKIGFKFALASTSLQITPVNSFAGGTTPVAVTIQPSCYVRYHVSAAESVVYISFNDTIGIIAAKDEKENWYAITSYSNAIQGYQFHTATTKAYIVGYTPSIKLSEAFYSITKAPSVMTGGSFSELFLFVLQRIIFLLTSL